MRGTIRRFATPPVIIVAALVIGVLSVAVVYALSGRAPSGTYITPTMGPLVQEVDATGDVKAATSVDLGFQIGGEIANAGPSVGTHVNAGATLGALSSADLQAALAQAKAALEEQQANLASLQAGTRPESLAVSQTAVANAEDSVAQAKQSVIQVAQDAYAKSDDAIHNKVDLLFNNARTSTPVLLVTLSNSQDQATMISGRISMEALLSGWQQSLAALPSDPGSVDTDTLASTTRDHLQQVNAYLALAAASLTEAIPSSLYPSATIQAYEADISTARTNVSADIAALNTAETAEQNAQAALASAQSELTLAQAPATPEAIEAQEAQVAAAEANVQAAQAKLAEGVITAPIAGTITVNNMEPGEIASPGVPEISMVSDTKFQFETYVSQADIAKVQVGNTAQVELDAYESAAPLAAHVIAIDPAATVQNGASSYKVTLQFDEDDPRISAGETGSVKIITQSLSSVMSVPSSAIITEGSDHFVIEKTTGGEAQVPVQIGISSSPSGSDGGSTQIVSGITSTDQIRSFGNN